MQLALFLIHAEATQHDVWGSMLRDFEQSTQQPVVVWSDSQLQELQGTQVAETAMSYRCAKHAIVTCCAATHACVNDWQRAYLQM